jgi:hypothetical protein
MNQPLKKGREGDFLVGVALWLCFSASDAGCAVLERNAEKFCPKLNN